MEHVLKAKDVEMHPAVPHVDLLKISFLNSRIVIRTQPDLDMFPASYQTREHVAIGIDT